MGRITGHKIDLHPISILQHSFIETVVSQNPPPYLPVLCIITHSKAKLDDYSHAMQEARSPRTSALYCHETMPARAAATNIVQYNSPSCEIHTAIPIATSPLYVASGTVRCAMGGKYIFTATCSAIHIWKMYVPARECVLFAGHNVHTGFEDGVCNISRFNGITDMFACKDGLLIFDLYNKAVRKVCFEMAGLKTGSAPAIVRTIVGPPVVPLALHEYLHVSSQRECPLLEYDFSNPQRMTMIEGDNCLRFVVMDHVEQASSWRFVVFHEDPQYNIMFYSTSYYDSFQDPRALIVYTDTSSLAFDKYCMVADKNSMHMFQLKPSCMGADTDIKTVIFNQKRVITDICIVQNLVFVTSDKYLFRLHGYSAFRLLFRTMAGEKILMMKVMSFANETPESMNPTLVDSVYGITTDVSGRFACIVDPNNAGHCRIAMAYVHDVEKSAVAFLSYKERASDNKFLIRLHESIILQSSYFAQKLAKCSSTGNVIDDVTWMGANEMIPLTVLCYMSNIPFIFGQMHTTPYSFASYGPVSLLHLFYAGKKTNVERLCIDVCDRIRNDLKGNVDIALRQVEDFCTGISHFSDEESQFTDLIVALKEFMASVRIVDLWSFLAMMQNATPPVQAIMAKLLPVLEHDEPTVDATVDDTHAYDLTDAQDYFDAMYETDMNASAFDEIEFIVTSPAMSQLEDIDIMNEMI